MLQLLHPNGHLFQRVESASTVTLCLEITVLTLSYLTQGSLSLTLRSQRKKRPGQRRLHLSRIDMCRKKASHGRLKHFLVPLNSHRGLVDLDVYALNLFLDSSRCVLQCSRQAAYLGRDRLDRRRQCHLPLDFQSLAPFLQYLRNCIGDQG